MNNTLFIIIIIAFGLLAMFVIPQFLVRRATFKVIQIFQQHNAIGVKNAKEIDELGLSPRSFVEGMFRGRDYKPRALQSLIRSEIVLMTEDGKLYISEEKLISLKLYKS